MNANHSLLNDLNRREFIKGGMAAAAVNKIGPSEPLQRRPDIVLFMVDQLSASWLWESHAVNLPNFTKLRQQGVAFDRTCVSNPVCVPSRASLATGLRTRGHGVLQNGYQLDPALPTFSQLLQRAGWTTGAFGKLHHRSQFSGVHHDYRPYGFDLVHNTEDARAGFWLDWIAKVHPEHYEAALVTINDGQIPELRAYGLDRIDLAARISSVRKKYQWATAEYPHGNPDHYTLPFPAHVSQTEWITQNAVEYIRNTDRSRPLYAQISYVQPHSPSQPPAEYMQNVDVSKIAMPAPIEWINDPLHPKCFPQTEGAQTRLPDDWRSIRQYYFADLSHLDAQLGRVISALKAAGRYDNTYVVVLSDHGELLLDHGFTGKGERHYDSCIRVPLVVSGPGLRRGLARNELVQLEDIFPTVIDMAGLVMPRPDVSGTFLDDIMPPGAEAYPGRSLLPLCRGEQPSWRESVEIESFNNIRSSVPEFWARTVRTADWRYTLYPNASGEQLFHLKEDPLEQHNLAADPHFSGVRSEMRDRLLESLILQDYPHTPRDRYRLGVF